MTLGGCEVAHLVEDVVGGQEHLRLQEGDPAILQESGGVHYGLAGLGVGGRDQAAYDGDAMRDGGDLLGCLAIARHERWALD